ncbi:alpha/beta fold hydrolase [Streptomyces sp. MBT65]|uniref:alpha/beta fold hydrolase n=1 Tax=Streptomyces sp. MBT65 TaxID=1488395 RepID=UPI0035AFD3BD
MYEPLLDRLADRWRLIAPDYPGFGHSDAPAPCEFAYTFDHLADTTRLLGRSWPPRAGAAGEPPVPDRHPRMTAGRRRRDRPLRPRPGKPCRSSRTGASGGPASR